MKSYFAVLVVILAVVFTAPAVPQKSALQSKGTDPTPASNTHTSSGPDCSGSWPTDMAFALMKNAGITDNKKVDFSKTKTVRLASGKIGKDLYHQVYDVIFTEYSGHTIEANRCA